MTSVLSNGPITTLSMLFAIATSLACHAHSHGEHGHDHGHENAAKHGHAEEHGHDHDEATEHGHPHTAPQFDSSIAITRWTNQLELFAEHAPAVAGQQLEFLAHLTALDNLSPLEQASVTLVLDGPERVETQVTEKLRPGIFQLSIIAPMAGTYNCRLLVTGPQVLDTVDQFAIVVHPDVAMATEQGTHDQIAHAKEPLTYLKEMQWQVPFASEFAKIDTVVPSLEVPGEVTAPPNARAHVSAAITGRLLAPKSGFPLLEQQVQRGQLLATVAPIPAAPEARAKAELAVVEAGARLDSAQAAVARADRLIVERGISRREVDDAHRELKVAKRALQSARRARDLFSGAANGRGTGSYRITAPIDGTLIGIEATAGESIQAGDTLFQIVNFGELWIRAQVSESQAHLVRNDENGAYLFPGFDQWSPLRVNDASEGRWAVRIGTTVDPRTRTVDVTYPVHTPDERLRLGGMLRVAVPVGPSWQGVTIPGNAVLRDEGRWLVYVQVEGESFDERVIKLGPSSGSRVGVVSGLRAGERVVTRGANFIRLSSRATTAPAHGHVH